MSTDTHTHDTYLRLCTVRLVKTKCHSVVKLVGAVTATIYSLTGERKISFEWSMFWWSSFFLYDISLVASSKCELTHREYQKRSVFYIDMDYSNLIEGRTLVKFFQRGTSFECYIYMDCLTCPSDAARFFFACIRTDSHTALQRPPMSAVRFSIAS